MSKSSLLPGLFLNMPPNRDPDCQQQQQQQQQNGNAFADDLIACMLLIKAAWINTCWQDSCNC
jgi:hypothetical protein